MTSSSEQPSTDRAPMRELLYRRHEGWDSDDLGEAARGWLDAVHMFATEALEGGVPAGEVLPAVIQLVEGWMLARDAASLATTWMALDGTVTVLERRLAQMRAERDRLATLNGRCSPSRPPAARAASAISGVVAARARGEAAMARVLITHPPDAPGPVLDIALSERNLLTLLSKLYTPGSTCSFLSGDLPDELGVVHACFRAEPDQYHYCLPTRDGASAGAMHPLAERVLIAIRAAVAEFLGESDLEGSRP